MDTPAFTENIFAWYFENKRNLPWRETSDPYKIWLSEIILQQTRIQQGLPYYNKFVEKFPSIFNLAKASEQEVLRTWQGLGYYSRARNLLKCANEVVSRFNGIFPNNYNELLKLPGIGPYTAAAIASIAFNEKVPAIDGNVYRILSRLFNISLDISSGKGKKAFQEIAESIMPENDPGIFNQALMEFGAIQCIPQNPSCVTCCFHTYCLARINGLQGVRPVKLNKPKKTIRNFHYFVYRYEDRIYMNKRSEGDIWQGLYDFHLVESNNNMVQEPAGWAYDRKQHTVNMVDITHKLTHQTILARFYAINLNNKQDYRKIIRLGPGKFYSIDEMINLPKPVLIEKFLKANIF